MGGAGCGWGDHKSGVLAGSGFKLVFLEVPTSSFSQALMTGHPLTKAPPELRLVPN